MPRHQTPQKHKDKNVDKSSLNSSCGVGINEEKLSMLVDRYLAIGDAKSAVFWAEKRMALYSSLNGGSPTLFEVAKYLKVLHAANEWQLISSYIQSRDLQYRHISFAFFYVSSLFRMEKFDEITCLPLGHLRKWDNVPTLLPDSIVYVYAQRNGELKENDLENLNQMLTEEYHESRLLLILAQTYLRLQNRSAASACVQKSIEMNPLSCEAVNFALKSHLMSVKAIKSCLEESSIEDKSLLDVIFLMLDYHDIENTATDPKYGDLEKSLATDLSVQTAKAFRLYSTGQINEAFRITDEIVSKYGYYDDCLLIYIGCLVEMKKTVDLYELSHKLMTLSPENEITWYCIGCYYYCAGQHQLARKYFYKCTTVNPNFGYGWLAYGHSLSFDREHDQAMNCYLRASRLLENFAEPVLYIGLEYSHANSLKQASDSISDAIGFCSRPNPIVLHEQGTVFLADEKYDLACESFFKALVTITKMETETPLTDLEMLLNVIVDEYWVNLYFNLGVTLFELNKSCSAICCFRKVVEMGIDRDRAYMMMGFCYSRAGRPRLAIPMFQKSLAMNPGEIAVKNSYDRAVAIVADLPNPDIAKNLCNFEDLFEEDLVDTRKQSDNRPLVGRFMIDASFNQAQKITCEKSFEILRNIDGSTEDEEEPGIRVFRIHSEEDSNVADIQNLEDLDRPRTAPAAMDTIMEDMQIEDDGLESYLTSDSDGRRIRNSRIPNLELSPSEILSISNNQVKKTQICLTPYPVIDDPQELMTDWFMDEIRHDLMRLPDEDLETLRPPPQPRRRTEETERSNPSDFSFLRTPVLRSRMRTGRRQRQ